MPFCRPQEIRASQENLGQLLEGHDIWTTPYELRMLVNTSCKLLCKLKISEAQKDDFVKLIQNSYVVNFIVDGLPAKTLYQNSFQYDLFDGGFPVGIRHPDGTHRTCCWASSLIFFKTLIKLHLQKSIKTCFPSKKDMERWFDLPTQTRHSLQSLGLSSFFSLQPRPFWCSSYCWLYCRAESPSVRRGKLWGFGCCTHRGSWELHFLDVYLWCNLDRKYYHVVGTLGQLCLKSWYQNTLVCNYPEHMCSGLYLVLGSDDSGTHPETWRS